MTKKTKGRERETDSKPFLLLNRPHLLESLALSFADKAMAVTAAALASTHSNSDAGTKAEGLQKAG